MFVDFNNFEQCDLASLIYNVDRSINLIKADGALPFVVVHRGSPEFFESLPAHKGLKAEAIFEI